MPKEEALSFVICVGQRTQGNISTMAFSCSEALYMNNTEAYVAQNAAGGKKSR